MAARMSVEAMVEGGDSFDTEKGEKVVFVTLL